MESLEKILPSVIAVIFCLSLSACNYGIFDWNNQNIDKTRAYKLTEKCRVEQENIARNKLGAKYNDEVDIDIYILNMCIKNRNYKFESDPKYR
ncbi:hypothetical protein [Psychrobacter sp. DAB_AL62B]|uniref:hypothetical protein n=1 Tax=Psychrobacter sp. DAB_AL62B TaxID=1028420 RepID=UPI00025718CA|nr:hypothetical protein [Psychrobacter sp. DAB_AL62B]AFD62175.1 hypothetical protein [Psychrobacter sp. DAB_AL62B]MDE4456180.1 hypothetical protein [Psychrobacter sp. DAB_AL62B]